MFYARGVAKMEIPDRMESPRTEGSGLKWVVGLALAALFVVIGVNVAYVSRGRAELSELTTANQDLKSSLTQMKTQMLSMRQQLLERPPAPPLQTPAPVETA